MAYFERHKYIECIQTMACLRAGKEYDTYIHISLKVHLIKSVLNSEFKMLLKTMCMYIKNIVVNKTVQGQHVRII